MHLAANRIQHLQQQRANQLLGRDARPAAFRSALVHARERAVPICFKGSFNQRRIGRSGWLAGTKPSSFAIVDIVSVSRPLCSQCWSIPCFDVYPSRSDDVCGRYFNNMLDPVIGFQPVIKILRQVVE